MEQNRLVPNKLIRVQIYWFDVENLFELKNKYQPIRIFLSFGTNKYNDNQQSKYARLAMAKTT